MSIIEEEEEKNIVISWESMGYTFVIAREIDEHTMFKRALKSVLEAIRNGCDVSRKFT